jgi:mannose-6-phosphate isomerase-like protein (cupin superfamily)
MTYRLAVVAVALLLAVPSASGQRSQGSPQAAGRGATQTTPAPAPGSAGIYKSNDDLIAALKRSMAANGDAQSSSPIANTDQYRVNLVHREKPGNVLAHEGNTELHYIIEGSGKVVTGGTIVAGPANSRTIQGGESQRVKKGDVIIVPAGSAHWYQEVDSPITYLEVRFVAPKSRF